MENKFRISEIVGLILSFTGMMLKIQGYVYSTLIILIAAAYLLIKDISRE